MPDAHARWVSWLPRIVTGALAVGVFAQVALLAAPFFPHVDSAPRVIAAIDPQAHAAPLLEARVIAAAQLFGHAQAARVASAAAADTRFALHGTIASNGHPDAGYALLKGAGGSRLLRVGDSLDGTRRVRAIYPGYVLLEAAGRIESLRLHASALGGTSDAVAFTRQQPTVDASAWVNPDADPAGMGPPAPPPAGTSFEPSDS